MEHALEHLELCLDGAIHGFIAAVGHLYAVVRIVNLLDSRLVCLGLRQLRLDPCAELLVRCRCASLTILGPEAENSFLRNLRQPRVLKHAVVVPFHSIRLIKFVILIAVREDQDCVPRVQILDRGLADAQNRLLGNGWPSPALEEHDSQGEWLRLRVRALIEPSHPVGGGNARVVQARGVNEVEVGQLAARRVLRDSLDFSCCVEYALLPGQPVQRRGLAVADGAQHHHSWLEWVRCT